MAAPLIEPGKNPFYGRRFGYAGAALAVLGLALDATVVHGKYKRARRFYQTIFEHAGEAAYLVDFRDRTLFDTNPACERLTGFKRTELKGMSVFNLMPEEEGRRLVRLFDEVADKELVQDVRSVPLIRKDGARLYIDLSASMVNIDDRKTILVIARDATERRAAELERERYLKKLEAVNEISLELTSNLSVDEILPAVTSAAAALLKGDGCISGIYDEQTGKLTHIELYGLPGEISDHHDDLVRAAFERVAVSPEPTILNDYQKTGLLKPLRDAGVESLIAVPFIYEGEVLGAIAVTSGRRDQTFDEHDASLLSSIARPVAIAIKNARLFADVKHSERKLVEHARHLEMLGRITLEITSKLELDELLPIIAEHGISIAGGDGGFVGVVDSETKKITHVHQHNLVDALYEKCSILTGEAVKRKESIVIDDYPQHPNAAQEVIDAGIKTAILVPIIIDDEVRAVIASYGFSLEKRFRPHQKSLLESVARQAAIAIDHAVLHKELNEALQSSNMLLRAVDLVGRTLDVNEVLERLVNIAIEGTSLDHSNIGLYDADSNEIVIAISYENAIEKGLRFSLTRECPEAVALIAGHSVIADRDNPTLSLQFRAFLDRLASESILIAPLLRGELLIGIMCFGSSTRHHFSARQIEMAKGIASHASLALQNAMLYAQAKTELERERHIAEELQRSLLPQRFPSIPDTQIGAFYESSTKEAQVGGDFYDVIKLGGGKYAFMVGDVSGKGIEAAASTAMVKCILRTFLYQYASPGISFTEANNALLQQLDPGVFVTVFCAVYDPDTGLMLYANAGHPYPCYTDPASGRCEYVRSSDPAICLLPGYQYSETLFTLSGNSSLVAFTDGVFETRRNGDFFGEERLRDTIERFSEDTAQGIADHIVRACLEFSDGRLDDDIAILVVKRTA